MGLLNRLVRSVISTAVDEVVDNTVGAAIRDAIGNNGTEGKIQNQQNTSAGSGKKSHKASGEKVLRERLEEVFCQEWSEYTLQRELRPGTNGARDYSYGLYLNGVPKAMIMVIPKDRHYTKKTERLSADECRAYGVAYLDFYSHLPNEKEYISKRLKEAIS